MKYAFLIGRNKMLSTAELEAFFGQDAVKMDPESIVSVNSNLPSRPQEFLNHLGGTIKVIEIFAQTDKRENLTDLITEFLQKYFNKDKKNIFSINFYPKTSQSLSKRILLGVKKALKQNFKLRFLNKNFNNANNVAVFEERLHESKTDIAVIKNGGKNFIGATCAVQDIESYGKRDYGKPFRDARAGMLPPKLAQIMINLAHCHSEPVEESRKTIFDPFCGTGTILMEALLMGFSASGSDISLAMVEGAKKNLAWLCENFKTNKSAKWEVFQSDAATLSSRAQSRDPAAPLAIVSEPYLGPPLSKFPQQKELEKIQSELLDLYLRFFKNLKMWLPKKSVIVMAFPCFRKSPIQFIPLYNLIESIEALGFKNIPLSSQKRTIIYERKDQIVCREIIKFVN